MRGAGRASVDLGDLSGARSRCSQSSMLDSRQPVGKSDRECPVTLCGVSAAVV